MHFQLFVLGHFGVGYHDRVGCHADIWFRTSQADVSYYESDIIKDSTNLVLYHRTPVKGGIDELSEVLPDILRVASMHCARCRRRRHCSLRETQLLSYEILSTNEISH